MKVRVAKKSEPYIKLTMVAPSKELVILRENKTFKRQRIEELIEEILTHEFIHIGIYIVTKDEIIAWTIDNMVKWTSVKKGCKNDYRLVFVGKKTDKLIFQTPT